MFGASLDVGACCLVLNGVGTWFLELLWTLLLGAYWLHKKRARDCSLAQLKIDSR
jgi:hypothetical protein